MVKKKVNTMHKKRWVGNEKKLIFSTNSICIIYVIVTRVGTVTTFLVFAYYYVIHIITILLKQDRPFVQHVVIAYIIKNRYLLRVRSPGI